MKRDHDLANVWVRSQPKPIPGPPSVGPRRGGGGVGEWMHDTKVGSWVTCGKRRAAKVPSGGVTSC